MTTHRDTRMYIPHMVKNFGLSWTSAICKKLSRFLIEEKGHYRLTTRKSQPNAAISMHTSPCRGSVPKAAPRHGAAPAALTARRSAGLHSRHADCWWAARNTNPSCTHTKGVKQQRVCLCDKVRKGKPYTPWVYRAAQPVRAQESTGSGFTCMGRDKPISCSQSYRLTIVSCLPAKGVSPLYLI